MLDIKIDIVGSFLRPQEIKEARAKFNNNEITFEQLREVEDAEIAKLVEKEVDKVNLTLLRDNMIKEFNIKAE